MLMKIYNEDQGTNFGKWDDSTSRLIYYDSMKQILDLMDNRGYLQGVERIADYGGANGIMKEFIPGIITIDIDSSKNPDIVDDILVHSGEYDLIIIRYVLHYLNDYEVIQLFNHIESFHKGKVLIVQFVNDELKEKYQNSKNELKYFRTLNQMKALLPRGEKVLYNGDYLCSSQFYKNRLNIDNAIPHSEKLIAYLYDY
ncbi:hypothetical protein UFOVP386_33 [uncultured Caudovirales phage]|uniref:AdoMet_MTases domain containing protein n=1 Tax=uncultured Caudovirales phage TaxID=2100421 RepID=A0A6J7X1B4_9CAUD|nr:hypothetical protein UFOVP386_33 [uncultured Caudovirales phage]